MLVMTNPTGKMPNVRPGITNPSSASFSASDAGMAEAASWLGPNTPLTKEVTFAERSANKGVPSALVPDNAIAGARKERAEDLYRKVRAGYKGAGSVGKNLTQSESAP